MNTKPLITLALLAALAIAIWTWKTKAPPQTGQWDGVSIKAGTNTVFTDNKIYFPTNVGIMFPTNSP